MRYAAALLCAAGFLACASVARADDYGPPRDVAAVQYDAAHLLSTWPPYDGAQKPVHLVVGDTVVDGDEAIVAWSADGYSGIAGFVRRRRQWWELMNGARPIAAGNDDEWRYSAAAPLTWKWEMAGTVGPTASILRSMGFPAALVDLATAHVGIVKSTTESVGSKIIMRDDSFFGPYAPQGLGPHGSVAPDRKFTAGYAANLRYTTIGSVPENSTLQITGRVPTDSEAPPTPHADAYCFLDLTLTATAPVTFAAHTALDVWFPHYLSNEKRYSLTIGFADKPIGPIRGTLRDNTLTFDLPSFTATPGTTMMAEIDGDPP